MTQQSRSIATWCALAATGLIAAGISHLRAAETARPAPVLSSQLPGLRKLMETPLRDISICRSPDNTWYLTGTVEPFWAYNQGIKVWKSKDMVNWEPLGFVWKYGNSPWHEKYLKAKKPLWAPEIHYLKGTFWLTYSLSGWDGTAKTSGCGLLMSTTGKAEGPYEDVQPAERLGDEIDASLFEDDDGTVYFLWHSGKIARMKPNMSGLAKPYHWLRTTTSDPDPRHHSSLCAGIFGTNSFDHVGYEGMFIFKSNGRYYLSCSACSEEFDGRYSCAIDPYWARLKFATSYPFQVLVFNVTTLVRGFHRSEFSNPWDSPYQFAKDEGLKLDSLDEYLVVLDRLFQKAKAAGAVCLKTTLAYERTLDFQNVPREAAAKVFGRARDSLSTDERKGFEDFIMWRLAELSARYELPFQIHTGHARIQGSNSVAPPALEESGGSQCPKRIAAVRRASAGGPHT